MAIRQVKKSPTTNGEEVVESGRRSHPDQKEGVRIKCESVGRRSTQIRLRSPWEKKIEVNRKKKGEGGRREKKFLRQPEIR